MIMTPGEIRRMFRQALEPAKQITVLAGLNSCAEWQIAEICKDVKLDDKKMQYGAGHNKTQVEALGDRIERLLAKHDVEKANADKLTAMKSPWVINLERYMEMEGYTPQRLAFEIGCDVCTVRAWLRCESLPRLEVAIKLCKILHTNLNAIFWEA